MPGEKGIAHTLVVLILMASLGATLYLSQHTQIFKPKAAAPSEAAITNLTAFEKKVAAIYANPSTTIDRVREQAEIVTPPPFAATLRPPNISSCGEITSGGDYFVTQDISGQGYCIKISNTQNVNLDCQNHSIASIDNVALQINGSQNFSIKNCTIQAIPGTFGTSIYLSSNSRGTIQNNRFVNGGVVVGYADHIVFADNTFNKPYTQQYSSYVQIRNNTFQLTPPRQINIGLINLDSGDHNTIQNNTINGGWDGIFHNDLYDYIGADDGIIPTRESQDTISDNIIQNVWDCGIENVNFLQDTKITGNRISNTGICGIGGWYWNSWLGNKIDANVFDNVPQAFNLFRIHGLYKVFGLPQYDEKVVYFKDNTFSNNIFINQSERYLWGPSPAFSSVMDFQNLPSELPPSAVELGNNVFKNNDFGETLPAPILIPASMVVDQGGNKCLPVNDNLHPLNCNSSSTSPTPAPLVRCITDSDCPSGKVCQLPVCAPIDLEQACSEAVDKVACQKRIEEKEKTRCMGKCINVRGY